MSCRTYSRPSFAAPVDSREPNPRGVSAVGWRPSPVIEVACAPTDPSEAGRSSRLNFAKPKPFKLTRPAYHTGPFPQGKPNVVATAEFTTAP